MTPLRARRPRGPKAALLLLALAAGAPPAVADDRGACDTVVRDGGKFLALAEKGDVAAAKRAWETFESGERRCGEDARMPFFGGLAHVYGGDPAGAEASIARLRALLAVPLRELNRSESEVDLDPHVLFLRAVYNFRLRGNPKTAAEQLTRVRMRDPGFLRDKVSKLLYQSFLAWGSQLEQKGELPQAIAQTKKAHEEARYDLDPNRRDVALRNLAQLYRVAEQWQDAMGVATDLVKRYPRDAPIRYLLASLYADQLQFEEAVAHWKVCLDLIAQGAVSPEDAEDLTDAPMRSAISLAALGFGSNKPEQIEQAIAHLKEFAAKFPKDARPRFYLGRVLWDLLRVREARDELEAAHALDPLCSETIALLATVYDTGAADLGEDPEKTKKRLEEVRAMMTDEAKKARMKAVAERPARRNDRSHGCR